jgi:hypothetical protein
VVSMLACSSRVRGLKPLDFLWHKNPQHAFLRKGSKAVCPMLQICGMLKIPGFTWKLESQAICGPFLARFLPSLTEISHVT